MGDLQWQCSTNCHLFLVIYFLKAELKQKVIERWTSDLNSISVAEKLKGNFLPSQEFEQETKALKQELLDMKASKEEVEEEMNKLRSRYDEQLAVVDRSSQPSKLMS